MKDMKKLTILMVAVIAIGVFSLPSVLSLGTGQHKFLNGSAVQCGKCHANSNDGVFRELTQSSPNQYLASETNNYDTSATTNTIHNSTAFYKAGKYNCAACHEVVTNSTWKARTKDQHTGVKKNVVCAESCHATEYNMAVGTGYTGVDAHKDFVNNQSAGTKGTYACMGCHTAVRIAGSPSYSYDAGKSNVDGLDIGGPWLGPTGSTSQPMTTAEVTQGAPPQN